LYSVVKEDLVYLVQDEHISRGLYVVLSRAVFGTTYNMQPSRTLEQERCSPMLIVSLVFHEHKL